MTTTMKPKLKTGTNLDLETVKDAVVLCSNFAPLRMPFFAQC